VTTPLRVALGEAQDLAGVTVYACGPTPMMHATADLASSYRRRCFVSVEQVMGCGMGGCYSCVVPVNTPGGSHFVRSCLEGPVFEGGDLVWEGLGH
jgi:dihydroorotate dehydrogenase electron transfer subunit